MMSIMVYFNCPLSVMTSHILRKSEYNSLTLLLCDINQTGVRMTSRQPAPSPSSDLSRIKPLNLTIGYIGEQC